MTPLFIAAAYYHRAARLLLIAIVAWASVASADDLAALVDTQAADPSARDMYTDDAVLVDRPELVDEIAPPSTEFTSEGARDQADKRSIDALEVPAGAVGGAALAKGRKAAWQKRVKVTSLTEHAAPSGTTGWVAATVELDKKTYKVPFVVFCVFDRTPAGGWTLVHIHFMV